MITLPALLPTAGRGLRGLALAVLLMACPGEDLASGPQPDHDAATAELGRPDTVGATNATLAFGDPGPPAAFFGPKCELEHAVGKAPDCISSITTEVPGGLQVFLNFCVRNGVEICAQPPEIYVSLILPLPRWKVGKVTQAIGGRAWIRLDDGRVHEGRAQAGQPVPVDFEITAHPVTGGGETLRGRLRMNLPRIDAAGPPLAIDVQVN